MKKGVLILVVGLFLLIGLSTIAYAGMIDVLNFVADFLKKPNSITGAQVSNATNGSSTSSLCSSVSDGVCPSGCASGSDADCCQNSGYCWINNGCFSCPPLPCGTPSLSCGSVSDSTIWAQFTQVQGATSYRLAWRKSGISQWEGCNSIKECGYTTNQNTLIGVVGLSSATTYELKGKVESGTCSGGNYSSSIVCITIASQSTTPSPLSCGQCQYIDGNICKSYACCADSDCSDNVATTEDRCVNSATLTSYCSNTNICASPSVRCTSVTSGGITVAISPVQGTTLYHVEWRKSGTSQWTGCNSISECGYTTNPSAQISAQGLFSGTTYEFRAKVESGTCSGSGYSQITSCATTGAIEPQLPDLTPTTIIYPSNIKEGDAVSFDSGVNNLGSDSKQNFAVAWYVDGIRSGLGSHSSVPANSEVLNGNSQFTWTAKQGSHIIKFVIDETNTIKESNEDNNGVSVTVYAAQSPQPTLTPTPSPTPTLSCSDGTSYGSCSSSKPLYCENGNLINKCGVCNCPSNQKCGSDGKCESVSTITAKTPSAEEWQIPVLVLKYFPVDSSGTKLDPKQTGERADDLATIRLKVDTATSLGLEALTRASIYKGYKDKDAKPSLKYYVLEEKEFLTNIPKSSQFPPFADHFKVLSDLNICDYVENKGVKQVWIWMWHTDNLVPLESNMAGPYGDVSNSPRQPDLPVCRKTYTVFEYNSNINIVGEGLGGIMEDHGHQIEHVLNWVDGRDITPEAQWNSLLFWGKFVGSDISHKIVRPGCGWVHYASNSKSDYDWRNEINVLSDCEDWKPDGSGTKKPFNCHTFSGEKCVDDGGTTWKIWWLQNIPGKNNGLSYGGKTLRNWWEFIGDFDSAIAQGKSLTSGTSSFIPPSSQECSPGATKECGFNSVGVCRLGIQTCQKDGRWGNCIGQYGPFTEICDNNDNDCDGKIDEDNVCSKPVSTFCSDSTPYSACSVTKPLYCTQNGVLVFDCNKCSCPSGQVCDPGTKNCQSVPISKACKDGTPYNTCSSTKPFFCGEGVTVQNCQTCGCPEGQTCDINNGACFSITSQGCRLRNYVDGVKTFTSSGVPGYDTLVLGPACVDNEWYWCSVDSNNPLCFGCYKGNYCTNGISATKRCSELDNYLYRDGFRVSENGVAGFDKLIVPPKCFDGAWRWCTASSVNPKCNGCYSGNSCNVVKEKSQNFVQSIFNFFNNLFS